MQVPFLDLKAQYVSIQNEVQLAIQEVCENTAFAGGKYVEAFEQAFATFCQCRYAIGVGSGTDALWLALMALDIGPGDEVITAPNSFIATAEAISMVGATPVFVDVDERTYTLDPGKLEDAITPNTKVIIPVHLYGQMADMDPIMDMARRHDLFVIEDACQAHRASYKGKSAGSIGHIGCFSFYPGKNLGAYGEAGAVVSNREDLVKKIQILRDHGQRQKYHHALIGWNARMDGIQGAVLNVKLKYLNEWTDARRKHAQHYNELLAGIDGVILPEEADYAEHVYHIYAIRCHNRDVMMEALKTQGIHCGLHYPVPLHLQEAYDELGLKRGCFPAAEISAEELISLPMYPELTEEQIVYVADAIKHFLTTTEDRVAV